MAKTTNTTAVSNNKDKKEKAKPAAKEAPKVAPKPLQSFYEIFSNK